MRSIVVSKNRNILLGMRISGIEGIYCKNDQVLRDNFLKSRKNPNFGIIVISESDFESIKEDVTRAKSKGDFPLVVTIPNRNGFKEKDFLMKYVKESIGLNID